MVLIVGFRYSRIMTRWHYMEWTVLFYMHPMLMSSCEFVGCTYLKMHDQFFLGFE